MHFLKIAQYFILNVTMAVAAQIPVSLHVMHLNLYAVSIMILNWLKFKTNKSLNNGKTSLQFEIHVHIKMYGFLKTSLCKSSGG